jgi:transcriptional regulator with GAF, ATPase, and Fis domain
MSSSWVSSSLQGLAGRRFLLSGAGVLSLCYAIVILAWVPLVPDLGLRTLFSETLRDVAPGFIPPNARAPQKGDKITEVGDIQIRVWPDLLNAPSQLHRRISDSPGADWHRHDGHATLVRVRLRTGEDGTTYETWCLLGGLPASELFPSFLWFFLKLFLFSIGAIVFWKRPNDDAAAQFFLLCVVTLGAYMGGYHWSHFTTEPPILVAFMVCAVLLPVVSLHFYLLFPHKKQWLVRYPRRTLLGIYGPSAACLAAIATSYFLLRMAYRELPATPAGADLELYKMYETWLRRSIMVGFGVAAVWYLGCLVSLIHSLSTVQVLEERKQVQCMLFGVAVAVIPIGFSLIVVLCVPDAFAAGWTTWPMFLASAIVTGAFAVSITRYRLMELDKLISSGMAYFLVSLIATLVYYGVAFLGTLLFSQVIARPTLSEALSVSTTALLLMLVLNLAQSRVKKVLDRRFSRNKSQLDQTLQQMSEAVGALVDPPALAQHLLRATAELLDVGRGAVYLREGDPPIYRLAGHVGQPPVLDELAPGFPLVEAVQAGQRIQWPFGKGLLAAPAQRQLQFLGGELAHPLMHNGRLLAVLVLGPKDMPYRPEDWNILAALAQLTVPALANAAGHRTIEQLNRELQAKVDQIAEQQRRILALQTQLREAVPRRTEPPAGDAPARPAEPDRPGGIVGSGPVVRQLLALVRKVSATDAAVFIRGESGTGKELLARAVHETSARAARPFVKVHCAALSAGLLESELFGHVKGAFTGAHRDKVGRFELADGGTLFLDEIGDISLEVQTKLLRVLQERTFERVGSNEPLRVDVRIITATHQNVEELIRKGRFREDLYYRLNVFPLHVPALRERPEDIPELVIHFLRRSAERFHKDVRDVDDDALMLLKYFAWPGNIRQLENVIERAVVIAESGVLSVAEMPPEILDATGSANGAAGANGDRPPQTALDSGNGSAPTPAWKCDEDRAERDQLVRALAAAGGNKAEAARALGVARSTLVSRLKKLGLA